MSIVLMSEKKLKLKKNKYSTYSCDLLRTLESTFPLSLLWDFAQALESTFPLSFKTPAASIDFILSYDQPRRNKK